MIPFVAVHRLDRLQRFQLVQPQAPQDTAHGGGRDPDLGSDLHPCPPLTLERSLSSWIEAFDCCIAA